MGNGNGSSGAMTAAGKLGMVVVGRRDVMGHCLATGGCQTL
jgi:hypothetical protein